MLARVASALVMAAPALAATFLGGPYFTALVVIGAAILAWEWNGLWDPDGLGPAGIMIFCVVLASIAGAAVGHPVYGLILATGGGISVYTFARFVHDARALWLAAGCVYIAVPGIALLWMRGHETVGFAVMIWIFAVVWATDIGAFFIGSGIGGPRIAPRISPGKTWAGLSGGIVVGAAAGYMVLSWVIGLSAGLGAILVSAILSLVAQGGDLFESLVKRRAGVKDSGRLIPGHGGLFDRVDGLLAAAPSVAVVMWIGEGSVPIWR